jgi:hypothetical protein
VTAEPETVVRQAGEDITASVRDVGGIADTQRFSGRWFCSACGVDPNCRHVAATEAAVADRQHSDDLDHGGYYGYETP